ncbi:MAG: thioredoxin family protein [Candidatus Sericytochromatia bacterium]
MKNELDTNNAIAVLFSLPTCSVCTPVNLQLKKAFDEKFNKITYQKINLEEYEELKGKYLIFSVPTFILFFENKEIIRVSGVFSVSELINKIDKVYSLMFE